MKKKITDADAIRLRKIWKERQEAVAKVEAQYPSRQDLMKEYDIGPTALDNIIRGGRRCVRGI